MKGRKGEGAKIEYMTFGLLDDMTDGLSRLIIINLFALIRFVRGLMNLHYISFSLITFLCGKESYIS